MSAGYKERNSKEAEIRERVSLCAQCLTCVQSERVLLICLCVSPVCFYDGLSMLPEGTGDPLISFLLETFCLLVTLSEKEERNRESGRFLNSA